MTMQSNDQAAGLRRILGRQTPKILTLVSGGSHCGKTSSAINLSVVLAQAGRNVLLLDENKGFHNVATALGLDADNDLLEALNGRLPFERTVQAGPEGLMVLAAGKGVQALAGAGIEAHRRLKAGFERIGRGLDYIVVDTLAGASSRLLPFPLAGQEAILVSGTGGDAQADAYGMLKLLHQEPGRGKTRLLISMVAHEAEGKAVFRNIDNVARRYLGIALDYLGAVAQDSSIRKGRHVGRAAVEMFPDAPSSRNWREQARRIMQWPSSGKDAGLDALIQRLLDTGRVTNVAEVDAAFY
jgi:flagellar biosynthesis protein FlhG